MILKSGNEVSNEELSILAEELLFASYGQSFDMFGGREIIMESEVSSGKTTEDAVEMLDIVWSFVEEVNTIMMREHARIVKGGLHNRKW